MNVVTKMVKDVTKLTIVIAILLLLVSLFFEKLNVAIASVALTTVISLINFNIIVYSTLDLHKIVTKSYLYYILRLILAGIALVIGLYFKLNLVLLLLGLFTNKVAIVIYGILNKEGKDGF